MKRRHGASAQQRRTALIDAAIAVAAEKGMAGVTHRAVTEKAGLPLATVGYFFDSITELAQEALRVRVAEDVAASQELTAALAEQQSSPAEMAEAFAGFATAPREDVLAFFEALLSAARDPGFRPVVAEVIGSGRAAVAAATTAAGAPDADAAAFLALVHGYLLHTLAAPDLVAPDGLLRGIRALFIGQLVEQGRVELALELARS
ncbi:hypothetical protein GCM10028801_23750 [Nocardioides maradonensis]